ncbi:hypothetical protein O3M35_011020 [Rhynocoris fuscipes]|uniref:Dual specificity phosphatase catalytic domain-containing protein n=1 Tax=Rhynocoris fuscipes TaxID=488301 RepID=A0AAW1CTL2_9HEMI
MIHFDSSLAGMSRSVTVAVAYIMSVTSLNWKEALKVVRVGRSVANPNTGFQKQLEEFEMTKLMDERRRLKERFPSLALSATDEAECQILLNSYEGLLLSKNICEGNCAMGEVCPTGLCRSPSKTRAVPPARRRSSTNTPPGSPGRMLPSTPQPVRHLSRSPSSLSSAGSPSASRRTRSGPAAYGSAPPSRSVSRTDLLTAIPVSAPTSPRPSPAHSAGAAAAAARRRV